MTITNRPSSAGPRSNRFDFIDSAKGVAIVLVVMNHGYGYVESLGIENHSIDYINNLLSTLRMPLFFLLSGMLARSWLKKSWRELFVGKVLFLMWVYVVWVLIRFLFFSVVPSLIYPSESGSFLRLFAQLVWSSFPTWFLYALAVFFVLAKLLGRVPIAVQLILSGTISAIFLADLLTLPSSLWTGILEFFFFFLLGHLACDKLLAIGSHSWSAVLAVCFIPAWLIAALGVAALGAEGIPGLRFAVALIAVPAGIGVGVLSSRIFVLRYLGVNTLPVYLAHTLVMGGIAVALVGNPYLEEPSAALILPFALTVISIAASLAIFISVRKMKIIGLYEVPVSISRWVDRKLDFDKHG